MKSRLELGPKGVRALAAHAAMNGSFAEDGKAIARVLIAAARANEDVREWRHSERRGRESIARLRAARGELEDRQPTS